MFLKFFPSDPKESFWTKKSQFKNKQKDRIIVVLRTERDETIIKGHSGVLEFIVIAAVQRREALRSPREEFVLLSGFLSDFLVDHVVVAPVADWLLLATNNAEEEGDEEEEQTAGHHQTDDHL